MEVATSTAAQNDAPFVFWDGSGKIVPHLLFEFFSREGIGKYFPESARWKNSTPMILKVRGNILSEVNVTFLLETAKNHILKCTEESGEAGPILDSLHKSTNLLSDKNLMLLPTLDLDFISDTREYGYLFFKNGIVEITADNIVLKDYGDFDRYLWESSIINLDFREVAFAELMEKCDFMQFLKDVTVVSDGEKSKVRLKCLASGIGYLLHRFKDPALTKAIILMDIYVNGNPNGGSGKTLLISAIGKLRKLAIIDGKRFDPREWFEFSSVELDTGVVLFDDLKKDFSFEAIFPLMSTGLYQRRKYKDNIFIPHEKAPKVALTTNFAINGDSSSYKRRMWEFEVSTTYSANYSPRDKFGHNFFDDWSDEEWNLFYNVMIWCLQVFLKDGLIEPEPINIKLTKLVSSTCEEFLAFADEVIERDVQLDKRELYLDFLKHYPEFKYQLKQRTFTQWLRIWGSFKGYQVDENHAGVIRNIIFSNTTNIKN